MIGIESKNRDNPDKIGTMASLAIIYKTFAMNEADDFVPKGFIEVHEITDITSFLKSIDWSDKFLYLLIGFHVLISLTILFTRKRINLHVFMFLTLLVLVYVSEYLNEVAAKNWELFSKQQYFDSNGLFISVTYSCPILMNCLFLLANFFHQNFELMKTLRQSQLRHQQAQQNRVKQSPSGDKLSPDSRTKRSPKKVKHSPDPSKLKTK